MKKTILLTCMFVFFIANTGFAQSKPSFENIATLFNNTAEAGKEYKAEFNTSDLVEGIYIAVLKSDKHNKIIKLSIVK